jgi:hypothetical protein
MPVNYDNLLLQSALGRAGEVGRLPNSLRMGIPFLGLAADHLRLRIANGTRVAEGSDYQAGAITPRPTWRTPTITDVRILKATLPDNNRGFLSVVDCHLPSIAELRRKLHIAPMESARKVYDVTEAECEVILQELRDYRALAVTSGHCLGVFARPAGQETVTLEVGTKKKIGLHVDSWSGLPLGDRMKAPGRLCVNLGAESRDLLVVNLPVSEIGGPPLCEISDLLWSGSVTETSRRFLRAIPDYPVVSVTIGPLEGYLAPTENMIHDASTMRMTRDDVSLVILGHFSVIG